MCHFKDIFSATVSIDLREGIEENTRCGNEAIYIFFNEIKKLYL